MALGRAAGVPEARITAYEQRGHKPNGATRRKLAEALGAPEIAPRPPTPKWRGPDPGQCRLAAKLRRQGLTFREVGERMGVSRQAAWELARRGGAVNRDATQAAQGRPPP
jgi:transcriptional regulator with XRE-family HTH domain